MGAYLLSSLILWSSWVYATTDEFYEDVLGKRQRTRDAVCAIVFAPQKINEPKDNSSAYKVSDLDQNQFQFAFSDLLKKIDESGAPNEFRREDFRGDLVVKGLEMWSRDSENFVDNIRDTLAAEGLSGQVRVIPMYQPSARGVKGALQRLRALLPMKQDYERPLKSELMLGVPGVIGSEITTMAYAFQAFPPEISIPMVTAHFGLLGVVTAFRRTLSNWMARPASRWAQSSTQAAPAPSVASSLLKQTAQGLLFVVNYNVTSQWPQIWENLQTQGPVKFATQNIPHGVVDFIQTQGLTTATQTVFFWVTFVNGVYRWEAISATNPQASAQARDTAAVLTPAIFWVSGPVLTWASTTHDIFMNIGPIAVNNGQAALMGLAVAGSSFWLRPQLLDHATRVIDFLVYQPIGRVRDFWRKLREDKKK